MFIFNEISSGGPGLFFVVALWTLFRYALQNNLHTSWLLTCCLFFEQLAPPIYKKYKVISKGQFSNSSTGPGLSSVFYPPGLTPVIKSSRPDFHALFSGSVQKTGFLLGIFVVLSFANVYAATIKSTASGGDWSSRTTWIGGVVPANGDDVSIPAGSKVILDANPTVGSLSISGTLTFETTTARSITVITQVTIFSGGVFQSAQSGAVKNHQLIVQGSIINDGTIDFSSNSNSTGVEIVFTGSGNAIFNCNDAPLTNLKQNNGIVLNKGTSAASVLSFIPGNTLKVLSDGSSRAKGFLSVINGTFNIIGSNSFNNPVFNTEGDYTIPATGGFWLGNQNATVTGMNGTVTNLGDLKITNGTFQVGISGDNSLETLTDGQFKMSGGTLNIAGNFKMDGGSGTISGGRINLATLGNKVDNEPTLSVSGRSRFEMYGSPIITIAYPNSKTVLFNDIQIEAGSGFKSIAGGAIQLGTEATPAGSFFLVNGDPILNQLTVLNECTTLVFNTSKSDLATTPVSSLPKIAFDKIAPDLTAPAKITLKCGENIPAAYSSLQEFTIAGGAASDNCTLAPASFKFVGQVQSSTSCPYTITRTYEILDISGNVGTAEHLIAVEGEATVPQPEVIVEPAKEEVLRLKSAMAGTVTAIANGNWNVGSTWSTGVVPAFDDDVIIPNSFTVTIDAAAVCKNITIQTGGIVQSGGAFTLQVNGNWNNSGTYSGGTNGIVEFTGTTSATISGTTNFEELKITKGSLATTLTINGTATVLSSGGLTLTSGLVTIPAGGSFAINPASALSIPAIAGFDVNGGSLTTGNFTISNRGLIRISAGTANFGTNSGNSVETLVDGVFQVSGTSVVNIAGRLENSAAGTLTPPGLTSGISVSGGIVTLSTVGNGLTSVGSLNVTSAGNFNFTGGTIVFQKESTATTALDLGLTGGTGTKNTTGGTFQFGNASTLPNSVFNISGDIPLNKITSFPNADLKLVTNVVVGQMILDSNTSIDLNGNLIRLTASAPGTYSFPLDNGSGVSIPVSVTFTSGTFAGGAYIELATTGSKHPNNASATNYLNRYWTVTTSGITSPVYDVTATYANADIAGTEAGIAMGSWTSALPWIKGNVVNAAANTISTTGITATSFTFAGINSDPPTVTITATNSSICIGASTTLTANPVGDPTFTYSWASTPAGFTSTTSNITVNPVLSTTYTVIVTDGNGFTATDNKPITVTPDNIITLNSAVGTDAQTKCINTAITNITYTTTGATGATFSGLPAGVTAVWASNTITISGTPTVSGSFNYSIPLTGGCGTVTATGTITVTPANTVTAPSSTPTLCINTALTAITHATTGATGIGAATGLPAGVTAGWASNTITISGTPTASGAFNYSIPLTGGCGAVSATGTITVNPLPIPTITPGSATVCSGSTGNIYFTEAGMSAYVWSVSAGGAITSGAGTHSITVTWSTAGAQLVTASYTNTNGCTAASPIIYNLTVNPTPTVNITTPAGVCAPGTVNLTLASVTSGSTAGLTYTYFNDAGATTTLTTPSAVAISGTYYIKGTTAAGCSDIKPVVVTIYPLPTVVVTNPSAVCSPSTVNLSASAVTSGSTASLTYSYWNDAAATNPLSNYSTVSVTGTYYIKGTTSNGCYDIKPVSVTVNQTPSVTTANTKSICTGSSTNISLTANVASTFSWTIGTISGTVSGASAGSGNTIGQTLTSPSPGVGGTVQYLVTPVSTVGNCTGATYTITVTVVVPPSITLSPDATYIVCEESYVDFRAAAIGSPSMTVQWQISKNAGSTWTNLVDDPGTPPKVSGVTTNLANVYVPKMNGAGGENYNGYLFRAIYTNSCGTATSSVSELTVSNATFVNKPPDQIGLCAGGTVTLTAKTNANKDIYAQFQRFDGTNWNNIGPLLGPRNGTITVSYSFVSTSADNGARFRIYFTGSCGSQYSEFTIVFLTTIVTTVNSCIGGGPVTFTQNGSSGGTWSVSGGGTITSAGVFTPSTVGCYNATYANGTCTDTKSFVVFPASPVIPAITPGCNAAALSIAAVPAVSGFTAEYAVQGPSGTMSAYGTLAQANSLFVNTPGCWTIQARYVLAADCGTTLAGATSTSTGCSETTVNAFVYPSKPVLTAPFNTCASAFALPSVPAISGFTVEWSIDGGAFTSTPTISSTPGCHTLKARYVVSVACGTVAAGASGGVACESDLVSVVIFPSAPPAPTLSAGCGAFTVTPPATVSGFNIEYSFDDGATWSGSNTSPAGDNCPGYKVRTRYVLAVACDATPAGVTGSTAACSSSPAVLRVVDTTPPAITCNTIAPAPVCPNTGATYVHSGTTWDAAVTDNCTVLSIFAALAGATTATNLTTIDNVAFNIGITTVTWTASDGCNTSTCSFSVTVNPKPVINPITATPICSGGTFTVTPNGTNGTVPAGTTYSWAAPVVAGITGTAAGTNASSISGTLNNTTNAAITVVYTVTPVTPAGCTGVDFTVSVTVNPILTCSISGPAGPLCPNSTGNTFSSVGGMNNYAWIINGNGTISAGGTTQTVTVTAGANCNAPFILTLNYNDLNGCSSSCTVSVNVIDVTKPLISCPASLTNVPVDPGSCYATSVALGTPTTSDGCGGSVTVTNNAPAQFPIGTTTVTWTATDACGNVSTCTQTVMVSDNISPVILVLTPVTQCSAYTLAAGNNTFDLNSTFVSDNCTQTCTFNDYEIRWRVDFADGTSNPLGIGTYNTGQISTFGTNIIFPEDNVTYTTLVHTVTYWVVDCASNVSNAQTKTVTIYPTPVVSSPAGTKTYCYGVTVPAIPLTGFPTGVVFDFSGGSSIGVPNLTGVTSIPSFTASTAGTATITITPRANGCTGATSTLVIEVLPLPTLSVSPVSQTICSGGTTNINISSTLPGATFSWTVSSVTPAGSITGAIDGSGSQISQTLTNNTTANATVIYTVVSTANGCGGSPMNVTVTVRAPINLVITNPGPVCTPATVDLTAASVTSGSTAGLTFTYWTNATATATLSNPSTVSVTGTYYIKGLDPVSGCSVIQPVTVVVNQSPALTSSLTPSGICSGATFNYTPTTNIAATISWSRDEIIGGSAAATGTGTISDIIFLAVGEVNTVPIDYVITMQTVDCVSTQTVTVQVSPIPQLNYSNLPASICSGEAFTFNPTSNPGTVITWKRDAVAGISNPAVGYTSGAINETLINTTSSSIDVTYMYHLNLNGCQTDIPIVITVVPAPQITASASKTDVCAGETFNLFSNSPVVTPTISLLTEGFNGATNNWTTIMNSTGGNNASRNSTAWTLRPDNYRIGPAFPRLHSSVPVSQFYLSSSNGHGGATSTTLRSPAINITDYNVLTLDFYHYFDYRGNGGAESAVVEVSTDGTTWVNVATYNADQGAATAFAHPSINLNSYAGNSTLYVQFRYTASQDYYWAIDNVTVSGVAAPTIEWTSTPAGFTSSVANPTGLTEAQTTAYTVKYTYPQSYGFLCSGIATVTVTVRTPPQPTITADYCSAQPKIKLTATGGGTYLWSTGETTPFILIDIADTYSVLVTDVFGCTATAYLGVANELLTNGNFSLGNDGSFTSGYTYVADGAGTNELVPESRYSIVPLASTVHFLFRGSGHSGSGDPFMIVNGATGSPQPVVWGRTMTGLTVGQVYYFSAWARSAFLETSAPWNTYYANLKFSVNGVQLGTPTGILPGGPATDASPATWVRFYGSFTATTTSALLEIVDLATWAGGNDFGIDDISFGTLAPFPATVNPQVNGGSNVFCEGSTVTLTANVVNGKAPFAYAWTGPNGYTSTDKDPVITSAPFNGSGTYTLTVTDGYGCGPVTGTLSLTINQAATVTAGPDQAVCAALLSAQLAGGIGGSATSATWTTSGSGTFSNANSLTADYFFGASDISNGIVTLTLTTNDPAGLCSAVSDEMVITIRPLVTAAIDTSVDPLCNGGSDGSITASATGGKGPYQYSWSTLPVQTTATATGLSAGTYTVTVTDANGCTDLQTATLSDPPVLDVDFVKTDVTCFNGADGTASVTIISGDSPTYLWNTVPAQTTGIATGLKFGMHTVTVTAANGCSATVLNVFIDQPAPPAISCPTDITIKADDGETFASNVAVSPPTYTNVCPIVDKVWTISGTTTDSSPATGVYTLTTHDFTVGLSTVTYTIVDVAGNVSTCSFTVTVTSAPVIACQPGIVTDTSTNSCTSTFDPGVPDLLQGQPDITWTWEIDFPTSATLSGTAITTVPLQSPPSIGSINFDHGTTTITWTAKNDAGTASCTQIVTVNDVIQPIYTPSPTPIVECVENIFSATYAVADPNVVKINPDPDYYLFHAGTDTATLDLDLVNYLKDNCCPDVGTLTWTITFSAVPDNNSPYGPVINPPISGSGQPSTYQVGGIPTDIKLWGDGVTFLPVTHTISYTVYDCHGNHSTFTRDITINPRPELVKIP